jgi:hypothetical protein
MKAHRSTLCLLALLGGTAGLAGAAEKSGTVPDKAPVAAKPSSSPSYEEQFKEVKRRVAELFLHRNQTPPSPDPRCNPFRTPGGVVLAPRAGPEREIGTKVPAGSEAITHDSAPGNNLTLLQQAAATLRVSGNVEKAGLTQLLINNRPYKEGDLVKTQVQGEEVFLRIKEIARRSVTLALEDAEMILKY